MNTIQCQMCHSENVWLQSYEDGGGDYGDELTPWYECGECGSTFTQDESIQVWIDDGEAMKIRKEKQRRRYEQAYHELRLYGEQIYSEVNWRSYNYAQVCASLSHDSAQEIFTGWINAPRKYKFYDLMANRYPSLWFIF